MKSPRIAILVGGKFHAHQMTRSLLETGHDVTLYTTFPASKMTGVPKDRVRSFLFPEIRARLLTKINRENLGDILKIKSFGKWAAKELRKNPPDVIISWSSFGMESFNACPKAIKILVRDSAHIVDQMQIFEPEFRKWNANWFDRTEVVRRELEEYEVADQILVCSDFIRDTFVQQGVDGTKIKKIILGADSKVFVPKTSYRNELPLRVIYFGALSVYKGVVYLLEATKDIPPEKLKLTLVGARTREFDPILDRFSHAEIIPAQPHPKLAEILGQQDVFVMPSLQDGYAMSVPQAMSMGLACVVSDHTGSKELIQNGTNGFIIPIRDAAAIRAALDQFLANPKLAEAMGRKAAGQSRRYSWELYGREVSGWIDSLTVETLTYAKGHTLR